MAEKTSSLTAASAAAAARCEASCASLQRARIVVTRSPDETGTAPAARTRSIVPPSTRESAGRRGDHSMATRLLPAQEHLELRVELAPACDRRAASRVEGGGVVGVAEELRLAGGGDEVEPAMPRAARLDHARRRRGFRPASRRAASRRACRRRGGRARRRATRSPAAPRSRLRRRRRRARRDADGRMRRPRVAERARARSASARASRRAYYVCAAASAAASASCRRPLVARISPPSLAKGAAAIVGDAAAGLGDEERAGGDVPRLELHLPVAVHPAGGDEAEVERGGADAAQALRLRVDARPLGEVVARARAGVVGKAGGEQRRGERVGVADGAGARSAAPRAALDEEGARAARARRSCQPSAGASTTPASGPAASSTAIETQKNGSPCAKLVVPSSGSTSQRRPERAGAAPPPSSATIASSGNAARSAATTCASERRSYSVTRSTAVRLRSDGVRAAPRPRARSRPPRRRCAARRRARAASLRVMPSIGRSSTIAVAFGVGRRGTAIDSSDRGVDQSTAAPRGSRTSRRRSRWRSR